MRDDERRLAVLKSYGILHTPREPAFDGIVELAARLCHAPVALITVLAADGQWIKAVCGTTLEETSLADAICVHHSDEAPLLVIPDLRRDPRTTSSRFVTKAPGFAFYAGAALRSPEGCLLGSVCVFDTAPRPGGLAREAVDSLLTLSRLTMAMLELRRALAEGGDAMTERLGAAQEAGRVGSFVVDLVSETAGVSAEFCRIFGLPVLPAYPVPRLSSLVIGADESRAFGAWERRSEEAPPDVEYRIRRPSDGAIRWIARHSSFERDAQGRPLRLLGTVQDITLRKAADARQAALVELGDELRVAATAEVAILGASRLVGETLSASRTGYAEADSQARLLNIRAGWTDPRAQPILGQYPYDLAPASAESLKRGATLVVPDIAADLTLKTDAELYSAIDVAALLAVSVRDEERVGAVFVHDRAPRVWSAGEVDFVGAVADRLHGAVAKLDSEGRQRLLNQELSHRLKNTLAIVQAMASQTLRGRSDPTALDAFAGRLGALGRAHDVLLQQRWSAARIIAVVQAVVGAVTDLDRFDLAGPDMNLAARIVMTLSLLLHELATNALKYGALSTDGGAVNLSWRIDDLGPNPVFRLRWEEKGGPSVAEPDKQGFGSRLIRAGLVGAGNADVAYRSDGLVAEFRAPLAVVSAG